MAKPCALFWDIENTKLPKELTVSSAVNQIRSTIIKPHNLNEIFFYCVCDVHKLPPNINSSLTSLDIDIVQAQNGTTDSADIKIIALVKKFVKLTGQDCAIILLSNDDCYGSLKDLKKLHNVSIYLISSADSFPPKLGKISDYTFMLNNGTLKPVKSTRSPNYFISISNYPVTMKITDVMAALNSQTIGRVERSAILFDNSICIGFPTLWNAERAIEQLNGTCLEGSLLETELIGDSPLAKILKCIEPDYSVMQLKFIKMNNQKEAIDRRKFIKFCITFAAQLQDFQCILSLESVFWIIFSCYSDDQKCLSKVLSNMFPDAAISEPPIDLNSKCNQKPYTIESWEQIVNAESNNVLSPDTHDVNDLRLFFRLGSSYGATMLCYKSTKWSLLYNLFENLYDLGAKKVILCGDLYCASFDSFEAYQDALGKIPLRYLEPLERVNASEANKQEVAIKMDQYINGIPWCLNEELNLHCIMMRVESEFHDQFMEVCKNSLGNRECIFIKSRPGVIWIGFPGELICKLTRVITFVTSFGRSNSYSYEIPSQQLLESITLADLAGDAYDLAFLSSQLEIFKPIARPSIIERISQELMRKKECEESVLRFTIRVSLHQPKWPGLSDEKIVKILVNFSKVIPLAVQASHSNGYFDAYLMYSSWHEAYAARHFIFKIGHVEAPYFRYFSGESNINNLTACSGSDYFIINDRRKVLKKILQNKSLVKRLDLNSSSGQFSPDIAVKKEEIGNRLQYIFVITIDCDFKFTSGMVSMIKRHLKQMDCSLSIKFAAKIWVAVDDLVKGNEVKDKIEKIKFKVLNDNDDDFEVGIVMQLVPDTPPNVTKMLTNKLLNPKKAFPKCRYLNSNVFPLGHFNYNYRKAVGMSISRYCQLSD